MKREIKFRGLRTDGNGWVYGDLINYSDTEKKILESNFRQWDILEGGYDVIPDSVGQFTGLLDKNGSEIYEGDILEWKCSKSGSKKDRNYTVSIYWEGKRYALTIHHKGEKWATGKSYWNESDRVLIGNIHEPNPRN